MKVAKKSAGQPTVVNDPVDVVTNPGKYDECIDHIRSAISCLGLIAKDDQVAKDAIANLSVILFDLQ